jgi:hypothetical protein
MRAYHARMAPAFKVCACQFVFLLYTHASSNPAAWVHLTPHGSTLQQYARYNKFTNLLYLTVLNPRTQI